MAVFSRLAVAIQLVGVFIAPSLGASTQQYDYVIVGGGVTGLVVANRLSEDKSSTLTAALKVVGLLTYLNRVSPRD